MSWKDLFRPLETELKQMKEKEKEDARERKREEKYNREIIQKFRGPVQKVISEFSRSGGVSLRESDIEPGVWCDLSYFASGAASSDIVSDHNKPPYFEVRIKPSRIGGGFVNVYYHYGSTAFVPLSSFTEEALAKALMKSLKKG